MARRPRLTPSVHGPSNALKGTEAADVRGGDLTQDGPEHSQVPPESLPCSDLGERGPKALAGLDHMTLGPVNPSTRGLG